MYISAIKLSLVVKTLTAYGIEINIFGDNEGKKSSDN